MANHPFPRQGQAALGIHGKHGPPFWISDSALDRPVERCGCHRVRFRPAKREGLAGGGILGSCGSGEKPLPLGGNLAVWAVEMEDSEVANLKLGW